ncbi:hypothetical protein Tdes44962_MAKER02422 [Teratosphaeria destructans]|uniref:C2H2-type domain-containing protein n=1 Tax=Teratosphaeria destructans TaxID=418781 RepID=A0A9W7W337_9PEZI|nr:hypothetical protein Tdes44962_MAKER02422 [Teratosphaeria destructans]
MYDHPSHMIADEKAYMQQARVRQRPSSGGSGSIHSSQPPAKKQRLESCAVCGTTYTTKRALARHCHTDRHRQNAGLPLAEKHPCSMCEKVFSREHDRLRHESETHRGVKRTARKGQDSDVSPQSSSVATDSPATPTVATIVYRKEKSFMVEHDVSAAHDDWEPLPTKVEVYSASADQLPSYEDIVPEPISGSNTPQPPCADAKPNLVEVSWLAEASDDESEAEDASSMDHDGSLRSLDSTIADSAVDLGSARRTESQQSLRSCSLGEEDRANPRLSTADIQLAECQVILPLRPRATMIHRAAGGARAPTADTIPARKTHICALCEKALEDDTDDLLAHLRHHLAGFKGEYICHECDIGFVHEEDLQRHLRLVKKIGQCGFQFEHEFECTGHHPPLPSDLAEYLTDADRYRLCNQLRHWEQSQLQAYMHQVQELVAARQLRQSTCYSIDILGEVARNSMSSYAVSVGTHGSAPCDRSINGHIDIGGLRTRMQKMSLKSGTSLVKHSAKRLLGSGNNLTKELYSAARAGNMSEIANLVAMGVSPRAVQGGQSVLSAAAECADLQTCELLIQLGANVLASESRFGCALSSAAYAGKADIAELLLRHGATTDHPGGDYGTPLATAAAAGSVEVARLLLAAGARMSQITGPFGCALSAAAARGQSQMVEFLIERGADVNIQAGPEGTPIGHAAFHGQLEVVSILVRAGADIDMQGGKHGCPLFASIVSVVNGAKDLDMVKSLLDLGAKVNLKSPLRSPLRLAAANADARLMPEVVRLLIAHGADVNDAGSKGTALHLAKARRKHWTEKMPFMDLGEYTDESIHERVGNCYEVIRLLKEAGAVEDGQSSPMEIDT